MKFALDRELLQVRESLRQATVDARIASHPMLSQIDQEMARVKDMQRQLPSLKGRDKGLGHRDLNRQRAKVAGMREDMMKQVLHGAQVICATCTGAGGDQLEVREGGGEGEKEGEAGAYGAGGWRN